MGKSSKLLDLPSLELGAKHWKLVTRSTVAKLMRSEGACSRRRWPRRICIQNKGQSFPPQIQKAASLADLLRLGMDKDRHRRRHHHRRHQTHQVVLILLVQADLEVCHLD